MNTVTNVIFQEITDAAIILDLSKEAHGDMDEGHQKLRDIDHDTIGPQPIAIDNVSFGSKEMQELNDSYLLTLSSTIECLFRDLSYD